MKYLYKYHTHDDLLNYNQALDNPNITLCSIDGEKTNDVHFDYKPYDKKIEYLKNNGKAYIDTKIKMHKWYGMGCTFAVTKHANMAYCIFCGSRTTFMYSLNWTVDSNGIITLVFDYLSGGSLQSGRTGLTYGDKMTFESRPDMSAMKMNAYYNGIYKAQTNLPTTDQAQTVNNWCFTSNNEWRTQESRIYEYYR